MNLKTLYHEYHRWSFVVTLLLLFISIYSCLPEQLPFEPDAPRVEEPSIAVSFSVVSSNDSIIRLRVSWPAGGDQFGGADYYNFTLRASKVITDSTTGPLPDKKKVYGTADTIMFRRDLVGDSAMIVARVWSVRRNLESTIPAQGQIYVKKNIPGQTRNPIVDSFIVKLVYGGGLLTMGPVGGPGIGPWVDTLRFGLIYAGRYPPYDSTTITRFGGDTIVASGYRHPNIKFSFSKSNIITHAIDSNTAVFRVLQAGQNVYIRATYNTGRFDSLGRAIVLRDSQYVYTTNSTYCTPWPGCYYDPWWEKPGFYPELPRITVNVPVYIPITCPAVIITYKPNNKVDTTYPTTCPP